MTTMYARASRASLPPRIALPLLIAALCAGLAEPSPAQGGWRQWEIRLHDGRRLEANPLGAPDDAHLSLSVAGYKGRQRRVARSRVHVVAALNLPDSLPATAVVASCEDAIVRRDGTTTVGRITLARIQWSEGVVAQRGDTVDLRDVAYLVFAARSRERANCRREATWYQLGVTRTVGSRQIPMLCPEDCRT
jgi:hypothetical protein